MGHGLSGETVLVTLLKSKTHPIEKSLIHKNKSTCCISKSKGKDTKKRLLLVKISIMLLIGFLFFVKLILFL
jgi:ABC-type phosphate transport system permease subunit